MSVRDELLRRVEAFKDRRSYRLLTETVELLEEDKLYKVLTEEDLLDLGERAGYLFPQDGHRSLDQRPVEPGSLRDTTPRARALENVSKRLGMLAHERNSYNPLVLKVYRRTKDTYFLEFSLRPMEPELPSMSALVGRKPGFVYLIKSGQFCKIGITQNLQKRVAALQGGSPHALKVLAVCWVNDAPEYERYLHGFYSHCRRKGEWFQLNSAERDSLVEALSSVGESWR